MWYANYSQMYCTCPTIHHIHMSHPLHCNQPNAILASNVSMHGRTLNHPIAPLPRLFTTGIPKLSSSNQKRSLLFSVACSAAQSSASRSIRSSELSDWDGVASTIRSGWGLPENLMRSCRMTLYNPGFSCSFRKHINIQSGCWSGERLHCFHCLHCLTCTGVRLQNQRPPQRPPHRRHGSGAVLLTSLDSDMTDALKQCPGQLLNPVSSHSRKTPAKRKQLQKGIANRHCGISWKQVGINLA